MYTIIYEIKRDMSNNNIESIRVTAGRDSLILTDNILSPSINERDKGSSWDGEVFIYKDNTEKKWVNDRCFVY